MNIMESINLIESYNNLECLSYKCKCDISLEENYDIMLEMVNDLKQDLFNSIEIYNNKKSINEYNEMKRIINESFVNINKARRSNDINLIESSIDDMFIGFLSKRKEINYTGDDRSDELTLSESQDIADSKIIQIRDEYISIIESTEFKHYNLMEATKTNNVTYLNSVKKAFESKHSQLVERDKEVIKSAKQRLKNLDGVELEVPVDNDVSFDKLISRYSSFDRHFKKGDEKTSSKKFEDSKGNLKTGIENFLRSGSAKKEVSTKKVSGDDAKNAISRMIEYCEDFLAGKESVTDKIELVVNDLESNTNGVEEGFVLESSSNYFYSLLEAKDDVKEEEDKTETKEDDNNQNDETPEDLNKSTHNRRTGITSLMTIAEKRYFDYINTINSLFKN